MREPEDALGRHTAQTVDELVVLPASNALAAVQRIRADDLDFLLVGSNITVANTPLGMLASFRLTRVQAISASSPVTSVLTSADWYVNGEYNETAEGAATQYTEQVYRMPGMLTRYASQHDRDSRTIETGRAELGLPEGAFVFFSAANFFKIIPEVSASWARVLAGAPGAWLVLPGPVHPLAGDEPGRPAQDRHRRLGLRRPAQPRLRRPAAQACDGGVRHQF